MSKKTPASKDVEAKIATMRNVADLPEKDVGRADDEEGSPGNARADRQGTPLRPPAERSARR